jgi:hypothetical protein
MIKRHPAAVDTAVDALAVFRLTRLLQVDEVPPMPAVRKAVLDRIATTPWGQLVDCPWCLSVWVGLLVAVARRATPRVWGALSFVLASSAVTGLITATVAALEPPEDDVAVMDIATMPGWSGPERNEQ